jgi:hypothetical protein
VQNLWWISAAILTLTLWLSVRVIARGLLDARWSLGSLLAWAVAMACACILYEAKGIHLPSLAPELKAFNAALLTLPLLLFLGTAWCYDRLRHR